MSTKPIDLVGKRFGSLLVLSRIDVTSSGSLWLCACDCGGTSRKVTSALRRKTHWTTGCASCALSRKSLSETKHGDAKKGKVSVLYRKWAGMLSRCSNPKGEHFKHYGGKGISVCSEWSHFETFKAWALSHGYKPGLSIDRTNPDQNYDPSNCEWVTTSENIRRRNTSYWRSLTVNA